MKHERPSVTAWMGAKTLYDTGYGRVPGKTYCENEVARMRGKGDKVRLITDGNLVGITRRKGGGR